MEEKYGFRPNLMEELVEAPAAERGAGDPPRPRPGRVVRGLRPVGQAAEGIDRQKLYEIVAFVALKTLSNYMNHIADTKIDPQFT